LTQIIFGVAIENSLSAYVGFLFEDSLFFCTFALSKKMSLRVVRASIKLKKN